MSTFFRSMEIVSLEILIGLMPQKTYLTKATQARLQSSHSNIHLDSTMIKSSQHIDTLRRIGCLLGVILLPACCPTLKTTTRQHGEVMQQEAKTLEALIKRCKAGNQALCDEALRKAQAMKVAANDLAQIEE